LSVGYLEAAKVPWALTMSLPSELARYWQSNIPPIWVTSAVLMVTKHSPAADRNPTSEPSPIRKVIDRISDDEVATLLVNEGPESQRDWPVSSTQSSEMPAGGSAQARGGASVPSEKLELIPPVTVTEALPTVTVEVRVGVGEEKDASGVPEVELDTEAEVGAETEPIGEKTVGGGPRSLEACAHAPPSTIAAAQAVIETLLRMARSLRAQTLTHCRGRPGQAGGPC
jgi:hypothetical protein